RPATRYRRRCIYLAAARAAFLAGALFAFPDALAATLLSPFAAPALDFAGVALFAPSFALSFAPSFADAASLLESPPSFAPSLPPSPESTRLRFFSLSDLKSVSYQPPPFRRNDGADIRRVSVRLPQSGHFLS